MGKKGSKWFSNVKRVFKAAAAVTASKVDVAVPDIKKVSVEKRQHEAPEVVSVEHFPAESSPDITNDENATVSPIKRDYQSHQVVAATTASVAEAAAAATQPGAKVVRRAGYGSHYSKEDRAATLIQSRYRGYLARRALRALKGLVRLQALVRGHNVRKQAQVTMRCMQAMVRVQDTVRAYRLQLTHEQDLQKQAGEVDRDDEEAEEEEEEETDKVTPEGMKTKGPFKSSVTEGWDRRHCSFEKIKEDSQKNDDIMRRERALAFAYNYQQQQQLHQLLHPDHPTEDDILYGSKNEKPAELGWNWLDRWMATQSYHAPNLGSQPETSLLTRISTDDISERTEEMESPLDARGIGWSARDAADFSPYTNRLHKPSAGFNGSGATHVPSYMAPTQSAKSKVRPQGSAKQQRVLSRWSSSTKKGPTTGSGCDTSSSGGGTASYQYPRMSSPKNQGVNGAHARNSAGYSPDSSGNGEQLLRLRNQGYK